MPADKWTKISPGGYSGEPAKPDPRQLDLLARADADEPWSKVERYRDPPDEPIAPVLTPRAGEVKEEIRRRRSKREAVAAVLADGQWHSSRELHEIGGWRYGARLDELRKAG